VTPKPKPLLAVLRRHQEQRGVFRIPLLKLAKDNPRQVRSPEPPTVILRYGKLVRYEALRICPQIALKPRLPFATTTLLGKPKEVGQEPGIIWPRLNGMRKYLRNPCQIAKPLVSINGYEGLE